MSRILDFRRRPKKSLEDRIRAALRKKFRLETNELFGEALNEIGPKVESDSIVFLVTFSYKLLDETLARAGELTHGMRGLPLRLMAQDWIDLNLEDIEGKVIKYDSAFRFSHFGISGKSILNDLYFGFTDMVDFYSIALLALSKSGDIFTRGYKLDVYKRGISIFSRSVRQNRKRVAAMESHVKAKGIPIEEILASPEHMLAINEHVYGSFEKYKGEMLQTADYFRKFAEDIGSEPIDIGEHIKNFEKLARSYRKKFDNTDIIATFLRLTNEIKRESSQALSLFLQSYFRKYADRLEKSVLDSEETKRRREYSEH